MIRALGRRWIHVAGDRIGEADPIVRWSCPRGRHSGYAPLLDTMGDDRSHIRRRGPITFAHADVEPPMLEILLDFVG